MIVIRSFFLLFLSFTLFNTVKRHNEGKEENVTTLQAVTGAGVARRIPRRRNSAEGQCVLSKYTGPGVQRPEAPTTNKVLLAACQVLAL